MSQIAKAFGISEGTLSNWLEETDVEDGHRPGLTDAPLVEVRERKKRNRLLEQENGVPPRAAAYLSQANLPEKYPSRSSVARTYGHAVRESVATFDG